MAEIAIPLIALGALYIANTNTNTTNNINIPQSENSTMTVPTMATYKSCEPKKSTDYKKEFFSVHKPNGDISRTFTSMTGDKVTLNYFKHDNMQPFYKGSKNGAPHLDMNSVESILDNKTGGGSQHRAKRETAPLFTPNETAQWIHGNKQSQSDFMQSRQYVSGNHSGVKPFEEIRVTPGLGMDAMTNGNGNMNNALETRELWKDKNVDQLRIDNKPKPGGRLMYGFEAPALAQKRNYGEISIKEYNKPESHFEMGADRWFTEVGMEKAQPLRAIPVNKFQQRETTTEEYKGSAKHAVPATYAIGEFETSKRKSLGELPVGIPSAIGHQKGDAYDYGKTSMRAYENNRSSNIQPYKATTNAVSSYVAPVFDILKAKNE